MVTMKDVGKAAGVSAMTVSNVLRGNDNVAPDTARRVREAADRLHYRLNTTSLSARSLRVNTSRKASAWGTIGLAIFELDRPYPAQLASLISRAAEERGYQTVVQQTRIDENNERSIIERMSNQFCDGLIFSSSRLSADEIEQLSNHRPTILLDDDRPQQDIDTILTPSESGAREAIEYLYARGARRIGIVGGNPDEGTDVPLLESYHDARHRRLLGCRRAFARLGLVWDESRIITTSWNDVDARRAMHDQEPKIRDCDALFCMTDTIAFGVLRGLRDLGIRVPEDMPVIGFDGIAMGELTVPSLTTVAVDIELIAKQTVDLLIRRINDEPNLGRQRITVDYRIIARESA